jgi:predicted transcriptional regulator
MAVRRRISINLSDDEYKALNSLANQHRVSMAWLGRHAVVEFIERYRNEEMQLPLAIQNTNRRSAP